MLKQVFNYPDNTYVESYNDAGYTFMGQMGEVRNDQLQTKRNLINYKLSSLKSLLAKAELIKSEKEITNIPTKVAREVSTGEVFIVHGHDDLAKAETARFIERLGFKPIILHEQASSGKTIIEKIEHYSNVGFGIVLYTPCDLGGKTTDSLKSRARQNVVFEHGYLIGKIGRDKVCALVKGDIETPNDISGVVYISMNSSHWQFDIAKELRNSGYDVDLNKL
ncbi:nucleotide-binding protein [Pedobacter sp. HDW13]|nr:nucleotide-binding protein [Pedobacter sp. HDW13]